MINAYKILVRKSEGKRPHGNLGRRRERNIRMDFKEVWFQGLEWIHLAQDRAQWWVLVNMVMKPSGYIRGGEFHDKLNNYHLLKQDFVPCC
jgi:hypothetical protein